MAMAFEKMERALHRRSKSASGIEGLERSEKQRLPARRSTDSRPYAGGNRRDDMFTLQLAGSSPFRGSIGVVAPMKKLLAEEMSRGVESKRRPPSLIARLMGLEGLPPHRQQHHQSRRDKGKKNRGTTDQTEFKDVYEDLEVSSARRFPLRWSAGPYVRNPEVAVIQQKIRDAKRLSGGGENHTAVLKTSKFEKYGGESRSWRSEMDTRKDGLLLEPHSRHISRDSSRVQSDGKMIQEKILPTRIVVLKPNLGRKIKEYPSWKDSSRVVGLSRPISKEARELAREITMRMRREISDESTGYRGDESSYDASESELEDFKVPCRKSFGDNSNQKYSSFLLAESSVNKEARRRLSERWRMSREYQDLELRFSKGRTLGEMLAKPDSNGKKRSPGISSRDGLMDEIITRSSSSSRSKSLPPPRSRKRSTYRDDSKFVKRNPSHMEDYLSSSKYTKSRGKKPQMEVNFEIQMEANIKDTISKQQPEFKMMVKTDTCNSPVVDVMMVTEPGFANMSLETSASIPKKFCSVIDGDGSAAQEKGDCSFQDLQKAPPSKQASTFLPCPGSELESSESHNKEADHPSPTSDFEVPFAADKVTCSSESFVRVGAELQDTSALPLIGKEEMQTSPIVSEGEYPLSQSQCWEYSYALDLLIASGLQDSDFDMFKTSWYSPDCPLDPKLFEDFEKQYIDDQMTGAKLERRLLFDRINSVLLQISMEHFDLTCPWVMPGSGGVNVRWQRRGVRDAIEKLIEQEASLDAEVSDRGMQWWDCKGEIEMIGNEIEKLLMDDVMAEAVLCM